MIHYHYFVIYFENAVYKSDMALQLFTKLFTSSYIEQISEVSTASKFVTVLCQVCLLEASETHISVCIYMPIVLVHAST